LKIKIKTKRKPLPLTQPAIHLTKSTPPLLFSHPHSIEEEKQRKRKQKIISLPLTLGSTPFKGKTPFASSSLLPQFILE
jgi:hypothetical protein